MGLRHSDAFGPIGLGIHSPPGSASFNPTYSGPDAAYETFDHIMSSPATDGSDRFNDLGDLLLALAKTSALRSPTTARSLRNRLRLTPRSPPREPLTLAPLYVPNTAVPGNLEYGKVFDVAAVAVNGSIGIDSTTGKSENDLYLIYGHQGDDISFQTYSQDLARFGNDTVDTILKVFDASGNLVAYDLGTAVNDDQFEGTDSVLYDVILPYSGTFYVQVSAYYSPPNDPLYNPSNPNSPLNPSNLNSVLNPLNPNFSQTELDQFLAAGSGTETGDYDLLIYRFAMSNPTDGGNTYGDPNATTNGDYINGGGGNDTLLGFSAADSLVGGSGMDTIYNGVGSPVAVSPSVTSATVLVNSTFTPTATFTDPTGSAYWDVSIDYGDQTTPTQEHLTSISTIDLSHAYSNDGTYTIEISVQDDDGLVGQASITVNVANTLQSTVTINVDAPGKTFDGQPYSLATATVTDSNNNPVTGLSLTYTYKDASNNVLTSPPTSASTLPYTVVISFAGNSSYLPGTGSATFTIAQATPTLTLSPPVARHTTARHIRPRGSSPALSRE